MSYIKNTSIVKKGIVGIVLCGALSVGANAVVKRYAYMAMLVSVDLKLILVVIATLW